MHMGQEWSGYVEKTNISGFCGQEMLIHSHSRHIYGRIVCGLPKIDLHLWGRGREQLS